MSQSSSTDKRGESLTYLTNIANAFDPVEGDVQFDPAAWTRIRNAIYDLSLSATATASPDEVSMPKSWVEAAKCGNCGGQGWKAIQIEAGVFDQEQCQWCFEQWLALGQPSHNDIDCSRQEKP